MRKDQQFAFVIHDNCLIFAIFLKFYFPYYESMFKVNSRKTMYGWVACCTVGPPHRATSHQILHSGIPLGQVVLCGFWVVLDSFCWLRVISDVFRWFAVLVNTPIPQHTEELTLSCTHGRM